MNKNSKILIGVIAVLLICAVAYYFLKPISQNTNTEIVKKDKVSVRMKWFYSGTMSGWFGGKEQGIFADNNIDLTITSGGPDNSSIILVASGTDLFGVAGADEVLIAREKGIPIVPIAVLFKESPIGFISKIEQNIKTPSDWSGKTVEVDYGSNAEIQYRALLKKYNVSNTKDVPYTYNLIPFIENKVDVSVAYIMDQVVTLKKKGIEVNVITAKEHGINPYGDVIITTQRTLKENPDLVKRFVNATIESQKWAIENDTLAVKSLTKVSTNLIFENEIDIWKETIPFLLSDEGIENLGLMNKKRWEETQSILIEFNALKSKQNLNFK